MDYAQAVSWLAGLEISAGWDLSLDRMAAALARRGHPESRFPALHIAGTNGKGSVAAMCDAVLTAAGHRTGLYTSPHLVEFVERIRAGGRAIPRDAVAALVDELRGDFDAAGIRLTHFEFATLLAFEWFARVGIDVAVVEVGLGGRLDATNLVRPVACAITSIGLDHQEFLGDTLAAIAGEKAGILKGGVPAVVGAVPAEADAVIAARARAVGAPLVRVGADVVLEERADGLACRAPGLEATGLALPLAGAHQRANAAVALGMLGLAAGRFPCPPAAVRRGLADVRWPGRLAILRAHPLVVVDGAHNPDGAAALARALPGVLGGRRTVLVFAVMADKAWRAMLDPLLPFAARAIATRVGRRGLAPGTLAAALAPACPTDAVDDPRAALARALAVAAPEDAILVTGSLFLVGEAYAALGLSRDLFQPWQASGWGGTQARA